MAKRINSFGINLLVLWYSTKGVPKYLKDLYKFRKLNRKSKDRNRIRIKSYFPVPGDIYMEGGSAKGHYFHQDLIVSQSVFAKSPQKHVDVGSRVDGLVAHIASFREIEVLDIRPLTSISNNIKFTQCNLLYLPENLKNYCDSLSCLHVIEHIGLGRYGDQLDPDGHIKGIASLHFILKKDGILYFSVPIGPTRIEFNAHRVFGVKYLIDILVPLFEIISFSYVDDNGSLHENIQLSEDLIMSNCECNYGCGIFFLKKS